jgi:hypothetical protein
VTKWTRESNGLVRLAKKGTGHSSLLEQ